MGGQSSELSASLELQFTNQQERVMQLTTDERRYLDELAAEIASSNDFDDDIIAAAKRAHDRRQQFAAEMAAQHSKRSKQAAALMCGSVWHQGRSEALDRQLFRHLNNCIH